MKPADDLASVYRETVLEHSREPHHFGRLAHPDREAQGHNPLCGDKLTLYFELTGDQISQVSFEGVGCAISIASASMLTDALIGQSLETAGARIAEAREMLAGTLDACTPPLDELNALRGVRSYPSRIKCATLAWSTAEAALNQTTSVINTERDD